MADDLNPELKIGHMYYSIDGQLITIYGKDMTGLYRAMYTFENANSFSYNMASLVLNKQGYDILGIQIINPAHVYYKGDING